MYEKCKKEVLDKLYVVFECVIFDVRDRVFFEFVVSSAMYKFWFCCYKGMYGVVICVFVMFFGFIVVGIKNFYCVGDFVVFGVGVFVVVGFGVICVNIFAFFDDYFVC